MSEERSLDLTQETKTEEPVQENVEETTVESPSAETTELETLTEGMSDEQKDSVGKLFKKASDFDGLVAKKKEKPPVKKVESDTSVQDAVDKAFAKRVEKDVLKAVVTEGHKYFIPELVPDNDYKEIIGYLPRNTDLTSQDGIFDGLKTAVGSWKNKKGTAPEKQATVAAELSTSKGVGGGSAPAPKKLKGERKLLKKTSGVSDWYPKSE